MITIYNNKFDFLYKAHLRRKYSKCFYRQGTRIQKKGNRKANDGDQAKAFESV